MTAAAEEAISSSRSSIHSPDGDAEKQRAISLWSRQRSRPTARKCALLLVIPCIVLAIALALGLGLGLGLHRTPKDTLIDPVVDLGYAKYQGSNSSGISQWLGMRYAAIPTGTLRFAAPAPPPKLKGVQSAAKVRQGWILCRRARGAANPVARGVRNAWTFAQAIPVVPRLLDIARIAFSSRYTHREMLPVTRNCPCMWISREAGLYRILDRTMAPHWSKQAVCS